MANFTVGGHEGQDGGEYWGPSDGSLRHFAKKAADISLPGTGGSSSRSLFIFSEENFIRKYAKIIIEWGYPFYVKKDMTIFFFCESFVIRTGWLEEAIKVRNQLWIILLKAQ